MGYLIGSIPFGLLLTKAAGLGDVRRSAAAISARQRLAREQGLAAAPCPPGPAKGSRRFMAGRYGTRAMASPRAARFGHCYPVWLGFKGGRAWRPMRVSPSASLADRLAYAFVWLGVLAIFRISSLAGMAAVVAAAAAAPLFGYPQFFPVLVPSRADRLPAKACRLASEELRSVRRNELSSPSFARIRLLASPRMGSCWPASARRAALGAARLRQEGRAATRPHR